MSYPKLSDKNCEHCGAALVLKRYQDKAKRFCNLLCLGASRKCAIIKNCLNCNVQFSTIASQNYNCCSVKCSKQHKSNNPVIHLRTCQQCGNSFQLKNITDESVRGWGKFCSHDCATRKYNFNENYFANIDTEQKAYWLGFLFADGNVYKNVMTLKLSNLDKSHLELFREHIRSEHKIYNIDNIFSSISISNKKLTKNLISAGCVRKKSLIIEFPLLPNYLVRHFIRGVFDGDGCISFIRKNSKHKRWNMVSGSQKFINSIQEILEKEICHKLTVYKNKNTYALVSSKKNIVESIFNFMYKDATVYLDRKYQKFL